MGAVVFAAKVSHVPSIWLSEHSPDHRGIRDAAIASLRELGRRARACGADTFVVFDVHWIVTIGFHLNGNPRHAGSYTSHELPHFIENLDYAYRGHPALSEAIAARANDAGLKTRDHRTPGLGLEYATLIPMHHMNPEASCAVLPVACNVNASIDESFRFGACVREAIEASDARVAVLASGSLSHQFWENEHAEAGLDAISSEFNRQVDLRVLELWQTGRHTEFLAMLPDYATRCRGEAGMADTAMLFGLLGGADYRGRGELVGEYFPSSGTGQCNVEFSLAGAPR